MKNYPITTITAIILTIFLIYIVISRNSASKYIPESVSSETSKTLSAGKPDTITTHFTLSGTTFVLPKHRNSSKFKTFQQMRVKGHFISLLPDTNLIDTLNHPSKDTNVLSFYPLEIENDSISLHLEISNIPDTLKPLINYQLEVKTKTITRTDTLTVTKTIEKIVKDDSAFPTTLIITAVAATTALILLLK